MNFLRRYGQKTNYAINILNCNHFVLEPNTKSLYLTSDNNKTQAFMFDTYENALKEYKDITSHINTLYNHPIVYSFGRHGEYAFNLLKCNSFQLNNKHLYFYTKNIKHSFTFDTESQAVEGLNTICKTLDTYYQSKHIKLDSHIQP